MPEGKRLPLLSATYRLFVIATENDIVKGDHMKDDKICSMTQVIVTTHRKESMNKARDSKSYKGLWLDMADFKDKASFMEACIDLHKDEDAPKILFLGSDLPPCLVKEDDVSESVWDVLSNQPHAVPAAIAFVEMRGYWHADEFIDCYLGEYESLDEFGESFMYEQGWLDYAPVHMHQYICFGKFTDDLVDAGDVWYYHYLGRPTFSFFSCP